MNNTLLDELAEKCGCAYLSDLKYTTDPHLILEKLGQIEAAKYDLHEWISSASYLVRDNAFTAETVEIAKAKLTDIYQRKVQKSL